jgi:nitroreductase
MLEGWKPIDWRYGVVRYERDDGAKINQRMTAGGNIKWEAWHPRRGTAASDKGYPRSFSSPKAAEKWIVAQDAR